MTKRDILHLDGIKWFELIRALGSRKWASKKNTGNGDQGLGILQIKSNHKAPAPKQNHPFCHPGRIQVWANAGNGHWAIGKQKKMHEMGIRE